MSYDTGMSPTVAAVSLLVREYDEAIAFFTTALRFRVVEDSPLADGKRWVVVAPPDSTGASILLARAVTDEQRAAVGNQTGGRVFLFLHTTDFEDDFLHLASCGVRFTEKPRTEPYGRVVVFLDLYGNKWDLIEKKEKE